MADKVNGGGASFWVLFLLGAIIIAILFYLMYIGFFPNQLDIFRLFPGV